MSGKWAFYNQQVTGNRQDLQIDPNSCTTVFVRLAEFIYINNCISFTFMENSNTLIPFLIFNRKPSTIDLSYAHNIGFHSIIKLYLMLAAYSTLLCRMLCFQLSYFQTDIIESEHKSVSHLMQSYKEVTTSHFVGIS